VVDLLLVDFIELAGVAIGFMPDIAEGDATATAVGVLANDGTATNKNAALATMAVRLRVMEDSLFRVMR
jgi:hypothetical protein